MDRLARSLCLVLCLFLYVTCISCVKDKKKSEEQEEGAEKWKKKDIRDYNDADMERLFDQWEESDEDELEEDELPEWKKEPPKVDMSQMDPSDPEGFLKASKKGRTLMMFATVSGDPEERDTQKVSDIWHSSLFNAHIDTQKFIVGKDRVLFMLRDGSKAWEVKDFLVRQDRCAEVSVEGQVYPGAGAADKQGAKKDEL